MTFSITATPHSAFTVNDLDRAIGYFRDVLGCDVGDKIHHDAAASARITGVPGADVVVAFVQTPGHMIELLQFLAPDDRRPSDLRPCDPGAAHIAFVTDDIDAAVSASVEAGFERYGEIVAVPSGPRKGGKTVYMRSPDGYFLEFQQNPPQQG